ncbi:uncharacterized protein LOC142776896 [Rhipicephalus microplus]|uniref:uncharacterized protein LOC142776896 n=1 Tax=Rhipicephalus microplus TaxID=6941 RepID=UPI003F6A6245
MFRKWYQTMNGSEEADVLFANQKDTPQRQTYTEKACNILDPAVLVLVNPDYDNLECVTLVYDDYELSIEASRQLHICKTRELIFRESHVTAAPVLQAPYSIMATIPKSLLDSEPFRQLLEAMELRVCSRQRALSQDFQTCLTYTIVALVAPDWNKVGRYLCQGRDFLVADGVIPAVDWQILATKTKTELTLCGLGIRLRHMTLVDLLGTSKINHGTWVQLHENEVAIEPMECFVLPSLNIATATAVSFKLFSDCPFRSFKDLKKFWKNTYGYRLPDQTEEMMIYVKVQFRTRRDHYYVYPILCLRPREAQILERINPYPIIGSFLQYVKLRMGQLCSEPFSMVSRIPVFPTPQLRWTAKDAQTGIDNVSWTPRPSCQVPYRPQVSFEAPTVTVFIGDLEVVSEYDDKVQKTQQNSLSSLTKLKPSFQPKQSHVHHHHSQVSTCSRAQPLNEPGSNRDQVGDHLSSPQVRMNTSAAAFPAVVEWLNSCVSPVVQKAKNEITTRKTVSFTEVRQAIRTDVMSYKTETMTLAGTARSQQTLQGQQAGWAAPIAHNTRCVSEGKTSEEAGSKPTNHVTVAHLREKTFTQLGASASAQTVHYASSGEATRNTVPGHINVVLQVPKASAQFEDKRSSFSAPAQNINDASCCENHGNAKGGILAQARTAMRQGDPFTQLGELKGVSTMAAQDMRDFARCPTSPSSGGRQVKETNTDQSAQNASSMLLKGKWNPAIYLSRNTPPYDNTRKLCKYAQAARKLKFEEHRQAVVKPHLHHPVKLVREILPPNKANNHQKITFNHHSAAQPCPAPQIKPKVASLSIIKTKKENRITFEQYSSHKLVATGATKALASPGEKAYQDEEASYSCTTNILVDENATDREIAWQPLQSTPKEADDLTPLCSTHLEVMHKSPRNEASTRKCWTIAEVDSLLKQKKVMSQVRSS